jgi:hypothetical protein
MKRIIFHLTISLLTFAIGFSVVCLSGLFAIVVSLFEPASLPESLSNNSNQTISVPYGKPRFVGTFRGCGFGYFQRYETDDGQQLGEGNSGFETRKKARSEFKKWIAKAVRVIERVPNYKNRRGEFGERAVLVNPADDRSPKETVSILFYDGGQFIAFIDAPSLELALEFEKFLKATNYVAHGF